MHNWRPMVRRVNKVSNKSGTVLRLVLALCKVLNVSAKDLVRAMGDSQEYAKELHTELGKRVK